MSSPRVVRACIVDRRREVAFPVAILELQANAVLLMAREAMQTPQEQAKQQRTLERLDKAVRLKVAQEEANRPTIEKYAEYLRLHAKDKSRTKAETVHYNALGKRHRWHGRPQHVVHRSDRRSAPTLCLRRDRAPRSRRVRTARTSRGSPAARLNDPDEPHDELACPRCGSVVVVFRGIKTCGTCWAEAVLLLEGWAA